MLTGSDKSDWLISTESDTDGAVRNPGVQRGVKHPLLLLAIALILAFVIWNLFRAPTTEVDGVTDGLSLGAAATETTGGSAGETDEADNDDGAAEASTTTTTEPEIEADVVDVADLDPGLTRYDLFAQHSGSLTRIDLAGGQLVNHRIAGRLIGEFGYRLYFLDTDNAISSLPVDDLDATPTPEPSPVESDDDVISVSITGDGAIHLTSGEFSSPQPDWVMSRVDLQSGSVQRAEVDRYGEFGLVEVPGAGLFELTGDGFQPLIDGSVRLAGERLIVIEVCDTPDRCTRSWLDRATGELVDRPVPDTQGGWLIGESGRIAVVYGGSGRQFVDTETGEFLPDLIGYDREGFLSSYPDDLSPDQRFLAVVHRDSSGDVQIRDLTRGEVWTIDLPRSFGLTRVLFVPKEVDGE